MRFTPAERMFLTCKGWGPVSSQYGFEAVVIELRCNEVSQTGAEVIYKRAWLINKMRSYTG